MIWIGREEGVKGFWCGIGVVFLCEVLYLSIWMGLYELLKYVRFEENIYFIVWVDLSRDSLVFFFYFWGLFYYWYECR